jgi:hypothetical protein
VLSKFAGIKNTVTLERLKPSEFSVGGNVDVDDEGQVHRRRGYTRVASSPFSSLFNADSGRVYGVKDGTFGIINPDYSFISLLAGIGDAPLAYVQVGGTIYFSSVYNSGQVDIYTNEIKPWGVVGGASMWLSPVVNPTTTLAPIQGKLLHAPQRAKFLTYYNGRIYMAVGNVLWATELFLYNYVDATRTYMTFENEITGLGTVTDGIYVGDETDVWFLTGPTFAEFKRQMVMSEGVIPGSMILVSGELADPHNMDQPVEAKDALLFLTIHGLCIGQDSGHAFNLTQNHIWFPNAVSAAATWRRQDGVNQYLGVLDSQGTPSEGVRIGDYCDATIIRGTGAKP